MSFPFFSNQKQILIFTFTLSRHLTFSKNSLLTEFLKNPNPELVCCVYYVWIYEGGDVWIYEGGENEIKNGNFDQTVNV